MASVTLKNLVKAYGKTEVVHAINCEIADGELVVILGPSGCGKTTTLRMIAGLEDITSGQILFDGKSVGSLPPAERNVAMAFENYGLYEHWSVFDNIAYPLRLRSVPEDDIEIEVTRVAGIFGLESSLWLRPGRLSGGVRQRVGLARALVRQPEVFLLDEPMSHVDVDLRNDLRAEIKRIHLATKSTMIIVTHDQLDALALADRILVMDGGNIEQFATPDDVYDHPASTFVAGFVGEPPMNVVPDIRDNSDTVNLLGFRPHRAKLSRARSRRADALVLQGKVYMVEPRGERELVTVQADSGLLKIDAPRGQGFGLGEHAYVSVLQEDLSVFDPATKLAVGG